MSLDAPSRPQSSPSFSALLSRADDETLQELVGSHAVRLLNALDPRLATPSNLRTICMKLHSPTELLRDPAARIRLLKLLRQEDALRLASMLDLSGGQPYIALENTAIRRRSTSERRLFSFLGIPEPERHEPIEAPTIDRTESNYGLFSHQRRAHMEVSRILRTSDPRLVLHMPTGSGKTRTAMHAVAETLRRTAPTVVIWLAYSDELCEQAIREFETAWKNLGDRQVEVYRYWGGNRHLDIRDVHDGFMVAGLAKAFQRAKRDGDFIARLADRVSLVVIDEAHQAIAETYKFLLDYLVHRRPTTGLLGLTATPGRTWNDPDADRQLSDFFRKQKVSLEIPGYRNPVNFLIDKGYLAQLHFRPLSYSPQLPLNDRQLYELARSLDVPESILRQLAEDEQRNMIVIDAIEDLITRHRRIIMFAATVDHAKLIATVLQARGTDAISVTSTTPLDMRSRTISRYRSQSDTPIVLCNYGVLTTGFDAPQTSAAVIARPTRSLVLYSQMVGRATRGPRAGGNEKAEVVSIVDTNLPGFGEMSETFSNWEDVWDGSRTV